MRKQHKTFEKVATITLIEASGGGYFYRVLQEAKPDFFISSFVTTL
jgi:hypothetical protein